MIDEPTLGLAPMISEIIMDLCEEVKAGGTTVILAEERASHVLNIADFVMLLELGRCIWFGPRIEIDPDRLAAVYLGATESP
jgi:branched-chain amino acid transport system ATP-binding protein